MSEVCIITGVGPGTGSALVRRFAAEGYQVAMIARDEQRLINIQSTVEGARSYPCDVSDENALTTTLNQILVEMGPPRILIHNAVTAARGDYLSVDTEAMNTAWQVNVMALLTLSRWATPLMIEREEGLSSAPATPRPIEAKLTLLDLPLRRLLSESSWKALHDTRAQKGSTQRF